MTKRHKRRRREFEKRAENEELFEIQRRRAERRQREELIGNAWRVDHPTGRFR